MGNKADDSILLWNSFRSGSDDAYVRIYKKYVKVLYLQGLQFTRDEEIIKDCIQEMFIKLYRYRSNLTGTTNVKYYLLASMRNQLLTTLSKEKIYSDADPEESDSHTPDIENIEEILIERENDAAQDNKISHLMSILTPPPAKGGGTLPIYRGAGRRGNLRTDGDELPVPAEHFVAVAEKN